MTSCESYVTKSDCIGSNEIEFSKGPGTCESSNNLIYSEDNCNLGRCNWINNQCIKDGNANNNDDCLGSESCLRDNIAPSTFIENKPAYINKEGYTLTFSTIGSSELTSYCIGNDCCPSTLIGNNTLFLSEETPGLNNLEDIITLNYYSIDAHDNIEQINFAEVFIDSISPDMDISYEIINSSYFETQSDIIIT